MRFLIPSLLFHAVSGIRDDVLGVGLGFVHVRLEDIFGAELRSRTVCLSLQFLAAICIRVASWSPLAAFARMLDGT